MPTSSTSSPTPSSSSGFRPGYTTLAQSSPSVLDDIFTRTEPAKKKLKELRKITIRHARFYSVFSCIAHEAQFAPPGHIIFVVGPTGAGKTTLAKALAQQLEGHFRAIGLFPGQIAVIFNDLKLEQNKEFVWRRFYLAPLREMEEPLLDKKVDLKAELAKLRNAGLPVGPYAVSDQDIGALRDVLEYQLKVRGVRYMLTDEANLLAMTRSSRDDKKSQMEVLKSLAASVPETRFIFFGTSDALPLLHLSPQLSRRVIVIRFDPYGTTMEELQALGSAVLGYLQAVPGGFDFSLNDRIREIQKTVSGLYGATSEWIQRATVHALLEDRAMTWKDMMGTKPDPHTMRALERDVRTFQIYFREPLDSPAQKNDPEKATGERVKSKAGRRRGGARKPKRLRRVSLGIKEGGG